MTANRKVNAAIAVTVFAIVLFILWDLLTPAHISDTINPTKNSLSFSNIDTNSLIQTCLSALIGFLLSILIIEFVINKTREKEQKENNDSHQKVILSILENPIRNYVRAAVRITNKITGGKYGVKDLKIITPMSASVLKEINLPALYVDTSFSTTKIELYVNSVVEMRDTLRAILLNAGLDYESSETKSIIKYLNDTYYPLGMVNNLLIGERGISQANLDSMIALLEGKNLTEIEAGNYAYPLTMLNKLVECHEDLLHNLFSQEEYDSLFTTADTDKPNHTL